MKRGKNVLTYLFTIAFCFLAMAFFGYEKVSAANEYVCVDKIKEIQELSDVSCDSSTTDAYFILKRYEVIVDGVVENLEFPSTHEYNGTTYNVETIDSNSLVLIDKDGNVKDDMVLNLKSLTLPEKLYVLNSQALSNVQSVPSLTLPQTLIKVGSNVFNTGAKIDVIYLNHYAVKVVIGEGSKDEAIEFSDDAFRNANVGKIVCGNVDVYNSLVKGNEPQLSGENVTVELKFLFYSSNKLLKAKHQ